MLNISFTSTRNNYTIQCQLLIFLKVLVSQNHHEPQGYSQHSSALVTAFLAHGQHFRSCQGPAPVPANFHLTSSLFPVKTHSWHLLLHFQAAVKITTEVQNAQDPRTSAKSLLAPLAGSQPATSNPPMFLKFFHNHLYWPKVSTVSLMST